MERLRLCVVGSTVSGPPYLRIADVDVDVLASAPSPDRVDVELVCEYDVVVMASSPSELADAEWQGAMRRIAAVRPVLLTCDAAALTRTSVLAHRLGVAGCIATSVPPAAFLRTLAAVAKGDAGFARGAVGPILRSGRPSGHRAPVVPTGLTPRQLQVADLIAQGATDREIAGALHISESTAHKHVQNALRRAGARTRGHLVARMRDLVTT